jgi:DNA topoisomerase VI subunit B
MHWTVRACGFFALAGGAISFTGWALDIPRLSDWFNNGITIQPNTTAAVICAGVRGENEVAVRIKDTGVGIPTSDIPRVFELFAQIDPPFDRSGGGLGIGLTVVQRLVLMHGGTVTANSEGAGQGSEFLVRLPTRSNSAGGDYVREGTTSADRDSPTTATTIAPRISPAPRA